MVDLTEWPHPVDLNNFSGATNFAGFYEERYCRDSGRRRIASMRLPCTVSNR